MNDHNLLRAAATLLPAPVIASPWFAAGDPGKRATRLEPPVLGDGEENDFRVSRSTSVTG